MPQYDLYIQIRRSVRRLAISIQLVFMSATRPDSPENQMKRDYVYIFPDQVTVRSTLAI